MKLSDDTLKFIEILDTNSNSPLKNLEDLGVIIEVSATYNDGHIFFNQLVFNASIIFKLSEKLKSSSPSQEGIELIQKEFEKILKDFKNNMRNLTEYLEDELSAQFENKYLQLSKDSVINIINLSNDLALVKRLQIKQSK